MRAGQYRRGVSPQAPSSTDRRGSRAKLRKSMAAIRLTRKPRPDRRAAHSTNQIRRCAYTESNSKMEPIDRKRHAWEALPLVLPLLIVPIVMFLSPRSSCNTGDKLAKT